MDRRSFIASGLIWGCAASSSAQTRGADLAIKDSRALLSGALINGRAVDAAFDTGARTSSISETVARQNGIIGDRELRLNTTRGEVRVKTTRAVSLDIPGFLLPARRWAIVPDAMQTGVDCVVGAAALDQFTLAFSRGKVFTSAAADPGALLDIRQVPIPVGNFRASAEPFALLVDSGADLSWIDASVAQTLITGNHAFALRYLTPGGPTVRAIRVPVLTCGDARFGDLLFRVRPAGNTISTRGVQLGGLLGLDAMRLRDWSFSNTHSRIGIIATGPGRQEWIGLGIDFRSDDIDPGRVIGLAEGGPAALAGLKLGDRIVSIGGARPGPTDREAMDTVGSCGCEESLSVVFEQDGDSREQHVIARALI